MTSQRGKAWMSHFESTIEASALPFAVSSLAAQFTSRLHRLRINTSFTMIATNTQDEFGLRFLDLPPEIVLDVLEAVAYLDWKTVLVCSEVSSL
jgi:hypothetical protein